MSDGPHRSLPMRPSWKRVAKRGDKCAFATDEISAALIPALQQDCNGEVGPLFLDALINLCREHQHSLFKDDIESRFEALRPYAGMGIARVVLDEAVRFASAGEAGFDIAIKALSSALTDRATRCARQVEEHYFRESTAPRAHRVRDRIEQAISISGAGINALACQMLKVDTDRTALQPLKQQGLDDGVRL
jgi:hypothetical protein